MVIHVRRSKDNAWGFPETFKKYSYEGIGYVEVLAVVNPMGELSEPYVFRGEQFIPASQIDEEMGIEKYIKAKKPFYCLLSDGFIVSIRAGVNFITGEFLPEKTSYTVYNVRSTSYTSINAGTIQLMSILELPENVKELLDGLSKKVADCGGDRIAYLKSRFSESIEGVDDMGMEVSESQEFIEE